MDLQSRELVGAFYEAVGDPSAWTLAVESLASAFAADHGFLATERIQPGRKPFHQAAGLSDSDLARFSSERAADLWSIHIPFMPVDRPFLQSEVVSQRDFERSDFYNEIVRPTGGLHSLSFRSGRGEHWAVTLCRSPRQGDFDGSAIDHLSRLTPSLNAAFVLHRRLAAVEGRAAGLASMLNRIDDGALLIQPQGRIAFVNTQAERLLRDPDLWAETARLLAQPDSTEGLRLIDVVNAITQGPPNAARRFYCRLTNGELRIVDARQAADLAHSTPLAPAPSIFMFLSTATAYRSIDPAVLEHVLGLSRRESEIAARLGDGSDTAAIARETGLTVNTVRYYLKAISAKVGVRSHAALVAALQTYARRR